MALLLGPGTVITQDAAGRILRGGGVLVDGEAIAAVGEFAGLCRAYPQAEHLDAGGGTIMPGLVNAHAHFYGILARGLALQDAPPQTFRQVLERLWWRLDRVLDPEAVHLSALLGGIAAIRTGCTTVIDHHASPRAVPGSLDRIAAATTRLGLRACLCYEVSDRDGPAAAQQGIAENLRFLGQPHGNLLRGKFGLHAAFTLSDPTLAAARQAAQGVGAGFHIHCAEGPEDGAHSRVHHGKRVVERLLDAGILGPQSIVAHCVHVDEHEAALLAESGATVSHQPHSNMGNAVGWARILHLRERGVAVALGTDGYNWDMLETMRTAAVLHSHSTGVPGAGVAEMAAILTRENVRLASAIFGRSIGCLEPGAAADLLLLDYFPPTPMDAANLPWHLQFGLHGALVRSVVIAGRVVLRDRALPGVDEAEIATRALTVARGAWERFQGAPGPIRLAVPAWRWRPYPW